MKNSVKDRSNAQASCAGHFIESHIDKEYAGDWVSVMSASRSAPFPSHLFSPSATSVCVLAGTRRHGRPRFLKRKGNGLWCGADSRFIGGCRVLLAFSFPLIPQWLFNQKAMLVKPFHHKDLPSDDIAKEPTLHLVQNVRSCWSTCKVLYCEACAPSLKALVHAKFCVQRVTNGVQSHIEVTKISVTPNQDVITITYYTLCGFMKVIRN